MTDTVETPQDTPQPKTYTQEELDALVGGLKNKVEELLAEKKAEAEKRRQAEEEAKRKAEEAARQSGDVESLDKSYQEKIAQMQAEYEAKLAQTTGTIHKLTVGQTALATAVELAVDGSHELILPFVENRLKLDENGQVRVLDKSGALSALTLDDLKNELRNTPSFKPVLKAQGGSGGGASGDISGGAANKKPIEYTEQERRALKQSNPELFKQLFSRGK